MSQFLEVFWARTHNLKNIDVKIPKNKMTVMTGVSGSGKSSLAFSTIYNVGQQKYLESLSSYARMFVGGMWEEALVNEIKGLSPTISIDQKTTAKNPRSTVWTITEIYDYYKLLFLNLWERYCSQCRQKVQKDSLRSVIEYIDGQGEGIKFVIRSPLSWDFSHFEVLKKEVLSLGFIRFTIQNQIFTVNDTSNIKDIKNVDIIIDRLIKKDFREEDSSDTKRLKDSLSLGFKVWKGKVKVEVFPKNTKQSHIKSFSNIFVCASCGHIPAPLTISSFSFNSHSGACSECHWLWVKKVFLEEKVVNYNLTLLEGAVIAPGFWGSYFFALIKEVWKQHDIDLAKKYELLSERERKIVLYGTGKEVYKIRFKNEYGIENAYTSRFEWVINTLERRYFDWWAEKWHYDDFVVDTHCPVCDGYRLNKESLSVKIKGLNIWQLSDLSVDKSLLFFQDFELSQEQKKIWEKILKNIRERLEFLSWVWLDYITISRKSWTLSGWEAQRIRLATQIGTKLEGIIYVLDEPSIWLHPKDNDMLINNLKKLRDIWNTLIIVEHDEDIMRESDYIIDIWPWAWIHGWRVVAEWVLSEIMKNPNSITGPYLNRKRQVIVKRKKRPILNEKGTKTLEIIWAKQNNLNNLKVNLPLGNFIVVSWVSWGWKSSLINDILANYLANTLNGAKRKVWSFEKIHGREYLDKVVIIDQSPIWKTPRSNPATYTWVFTPIREVFSLTQEAQIRWYSPGRFSFNTRQWRCESCDGDGVKKIEMHFLPPVYVECESCVWKRYNRETLQVKYRWKTIADILDMTAEEALEFFANHPKITKILKTITDVWLGYIKLWQSATTLSGWEAQRVKLSTELSKRSTGKTFYILDEPTTGLHFQDVDRLLTILHSLVDKGNSVLVIEHNMDVIINADHIVDIWPEWWDKWWNLVVAGSVNDVQNCKKSFTWKAISKYLNK